MKQKSILIAIALLFCTGAFAQQQQTPQTPEEREKLLYENIEKQVDKLTENLNLEDWQVFYADSVLVCNYTQMQKEFEELSANRVTNTDLYQLAQDVWEEKNYNAFQKFLNEDQWNKYLKQGAARAKKARDKRAAKRSN